MSCNRKCIHIIPVFNHIRHFVTIIIPSGFPICRQKVCTIIKHWCLYIYRNTAVICIAIYLCLIGIPRSFRYLFITLEVKNGDIDFEHVNFSYAGEGGNLSLKDVNLHIKSGQIIGVIGGTGSAKSTLVQLIPRLYDVTGGCVKVGGVDVRKYSLEALRDQVSMVLQKNVLFTGSIYENIRWGDENYSDEEVQRVCKLAQADGFIQEFPAGYDTMIVEGGNNVSGGQKQRLCIARALLKKPKILILDDSTSAVDTRTDALIRQAFREEIPDTTKIIIAQRISSVEDADMIIVMDNGEINGIGTSEELLKTNDIYREVYESQVKGGAQDE